MIQEKIIKVPGGFFMLFATVLLMAAIAVTIMLRMPVLAIACVIVLLLILPGFFINNPNECSVLTFFGNYVGTIKESGFYWANPFYVKKKISLRARNHNGQSLKVNDKLGNPIEIAAVVVWQVKETAKASFEVDDYQKFMEIQSEAAVRHLANSYAYDNIDDEHSSATLRGNAEQINAELEKELNERVAQAGVEVTEARISHLAYSPEIAGAMLQRQQASAVVAARKQIVDGAVGMVEMALDRLSANKVVELDEERKAAMVCNLLVVLCSEKAASPVVNTGTLHH